jgi:peptide/nickel transport system permease protein
VKRFLLRRLSLAAVTLFAVTALCFFATHALPGNVGQRILGPFADPESVKQLNHELGTDRPLINQYGDWLADTARGSLGTSLTYDVPVGEKLRPALGYSGRLAMLAFLLVVPLSILGGVIAALRRGRFIDRLITVGGLSAAVVPEFVWAVIMLLVFGVRLKWLPVAALAPEGSSVFTQYRHLLLPALCLVFVLFGYIARITRAGVIEALDADYTRTATLKGLPQRTVIVRHVLRNALMPSIAVIASQLGYLLGGLVAIELIFNYPGFGQLLLNSTQKRDFPVLQAAVLVIAVLYVVATLVADLLYAVLNPRIRESVKA